MSEQTRERAEARLTGAFAHHRLEDTRPFYRQRLRQLREQDAAAFERALRHYEDIVLPALAGSDDAVETWIEYGRWLAELAAPGRLLAIDARGRAANHAAPPAQDALVLHIPDDARAPVLPSRVPAEPSPAQRATYDLLVLDRVELARV